MRSAHCAQFPRQAGGGGGRGGLAIYKRDRYGAPAVLSPDVPQTPHHEDGEFSEGAENNSNNSNDSKMGLIIYLNG